MISVGVIYTLHSYCTRQCSFWSVCGLYPNTQSPFICFVVFHFYTNTLEVFLPVERLLSSRMRPILAKDERGDSSSAPGSASESSKSSGKRKCVSSACIPCRKRKSKARTMIDLCSPEIDVALLVAD